jgi:hypothetical protein
MTDLGLVRFVGLTAPRPSSPSDALRVQELHCTRTGAAIPFALCAPTSDPSGAHHFLKLLVCITEGQHVFRVRTVLHGLGYGRSVPC